MNLLAGKTFEPIGIDGFSKWDQDRAGRHRGPRTPDAGAAHGSAQIGL